MNVPRMTLTRKSAAGKSAAGATSAVDPDLHAARAGRTAAHATKRRDEPVVGGVPRVSLLPPEMATAAKASATGRGLVFLVVLVTAVTGSGIAAATLAAGDAQTLLMNAQTETRTLLKEQGKYSAASDLEELLATVEDAGSFGTSTEIDWSEYIGSLTATMSPGLVMLDATVSAAAPWEAPLLVTGPLRAERVATMLLRVKSLSEAEVSAWVRTLEALPGFADTSIDGWTHDDSGYIARVTLNVATGALTDRHLAAATENGK